MKKKVIRFLLLLLMWIYPAIPKDFFFFDYVFFAAFFVCIVAVHLIDNRAIVFALLFFVTLAVSIYKYEYLFTVLPPLLLIFAYYYLVTEERSREKNRELSQVYVTLSQISMIAQIAYSILSGQEMPPLEMDNLIFKSLIWFFVFILLLVVESYKGKTGNKKREEKKILIGKRNIYGTALIGILIAEYYYFLFNGLFVLARVRVKLIYWFVFIVLIVLYEDSVYSSAVKRIETLFEKKMLSNEKSCSENEQTK